MNIRSYISVAIVTLVISSCSEKIEFDQDTLENKIDLHAEISPDEHVSVFVSTISGIGMNQSIYLPGGEADIMISDLDDPNDDGSKIRPTSAQMGNFENPDFIPIPGHTYQITVEILDDSSYPKAQAITTIPAAGEIVSSKKISDVREVSTTQESLTIFDVDVEIELGDTPSGSEYYHLKLKRNSPVKDFDYLNVKNVIVGSNAVSILKHRNGLLIDPSKLENNKLQLTLETANPVETRDESFDNIQFTLRTTTEDYYQYHRKLSMQFGAASVPVNDPVIPTTNVDNGFGIFAGYSTSKDSLPL